MIIFQQPMTFAQIAAEATWIIRLSRAGLSGLIGTMYGSTATLNN